MKNGGRGTKTVYKIMMIILLLAIMLKATSKENSTKFFIEGRNLALSMLCNVAPPVGLLFFTVKIYIA